MGRRIPILKITPAQWREIKRLSDKLARVNIQAYAQLPRTKAEHWEHWEKDRQREWIKRGEVRPISKNLSRTIIALFLLLYGDFPRIS